MTDIVDAAITEAQPSEPEADIAPEAVETEVEGEAKPAEAEETPFPKKAVNAITRRDRQIGKMRAELQQLKEQIAKQQQPQPVKQDGPPQEGDYGNYGEFLQAKIDYAISQKLTEAQKAQQEQQKTQQVSQQEAVYIAQQEQRVASLVQEAMKTIPDFKQVLEENADIVDDYPAEIQRVFLEAEQPAMAFHQLAKEGGLEALAGMSPYQAAGAIALAAARASAPKPVTKAPQPMAGNKGNSSGRSEDTMSGRELLKRHGLL